MRTIIDIHSRFRRVSLKILLRGKFWLPAIGNLEKSAHPSFISIFCIFWPVSSKIARQMCCFTHIPGQILPKYGSILSNGHSYPIHTSFRFKIVYLQMLYTRFVKPMLNSARLIPIERSVIPCMEPVINPNTCSIRQRILDFFLLFAFCSSVRGWSR